MVGNVAHLVHATTYWQTRGCDHFCQLAICCFVMNTRVFLRQVEPQERFKGYHGPRENHVSGTLTEIFCFVLPLVTNLISYSSTAKNVRKRTTKVGDRKNTGTSASTSIKTVDAKSRSDEPFGINPDGTVSQLTILRTWWTSISERAIPLTHVHSLLLQVTRSC